MARSTIQRMMDQGQYVGGGRTGHSRRKTVHHRQTVPPAGPSPNFQMYGSLGSEFLGPEATDSEPVSSGI